MPTRTAASQIRSGSVTLSYVRFGSLADISRCSRHVRFAPESGLLLFHQVRFVSNSLVAVSALFPTLATAASISSVVLLRRLRIRRAKSLVEMSTRFRGCFDRNEVATAALR